MTTLVLASTSPYRRELLARLGLAFTAAAPRVDETPRPGESAAALVRRLAAAKAAAVAGQQPGACVIGSDQAALRDGVVLGKAGSREGAIAQLTAASGREVAFHTAWCVLAADGRRREGVDITRVRFRALAADEIARYVDAERPWDCAGSFKCEGLGISLFEAIESQDPTALIGLPLIAVAAALRAAGYAVP
ncbi:Maf family protein [Arenimonas composti]|uniref:7-methyl-GTP pyrophosphatase n=1 Tax=Arenimonas composti TR7-09 = DSM 18010 TaxID=1121013 RepID=A0A091BFA9_9GAMM|nr:Maf family nucleotide pyrophosphatase [Arenimonas composti]KFN50421.1 hypothetical protein P873_07095 [Arenimonas composti TR7-09 = DSM 18010]